MANINPLLSAHHPHSSTLTKRPRLQPLHPHNVGAVRGSGWIGGRYRVLRDSLLKSVFVARRYRVYASCPPVLCITYQRATCKFCAQGSGCIGRKWGGDSAEETKDRKGVSNARQGKLEV